MEETTSSEFEERNVHSAIDEDSYRESSEETEFEQVGSDNFLDRRSNTNINHGPAPRCAACMGPQARCPNCRWMCICSETPFLDKNSYRNHLKWWMRQSDQQVYVARFIYLKFLSKCYLSYRTEQGRRPYSFYNRVPAQRSTPKKQKKLLSMNHLLKTVDRGCCKAECIRSFSFLELKSYFQQAATLNEKEKDRRISQILPFFQSNCSSASTHTIGGINFQYMMHGKKICFGAICVLMCVSKKKMRRVVLKYVASARSPEEVEFEAGDDGTVTSAGITTTSSSIVYPPRTVLTKVQRTVLFLNFLSEDAAEPVPARLQYKQLTMFFDKKAVWKAFCG